MPYQDWVQRIRGQQQQQPLTVPDYDLPTQVEPIQQPEVDPYQAKVEAIFGRNKPSFSLQVPDLNIEQPQTAKQPKVATTTKQPRVTGSQPGSVAATPPTDDVSADNTIKFDAEPAYTSLASDNRIGQAEKMRKTGPVAEDDNPLTMTRRNLRLDTATGRRLRDAAARGDGSVMQELADAYLSSHKPEDQEAARYAASLVNGQLFNGNLAPNSVKYGNKTGYQVDVDVPGWFDEAVQAYKQGGPDAAKQAVIARRGREQTYNEQQQAKKDAQAQSEQEYSASLNPRDPSKAGAFGRIAEAEAESGVRKLSGNLAGTAGAFAGQLGLDSADRYLTDIYQSRKGLNTVAEESQANQQKQSGLPEWAGSTAKALGGLPQFAGELALGPGGLIGSRMISGADKSLGDVAPGILTAPAEALGMNYIAEKGARYLSQKLADSLVPKMMAQGIDEQMARTGAEIVGTVANIGGRSVEGAGQNVAVALAQGETDPKKLREAAITGALLPNILGLRHSRIETKGNAFPGVPPEQNLLNPMPEAPGGRPGLGGGNEPIPPTPSEFADIATEAAKTQPDHPIVQALQAAQIDPETIRHADQGTLDQLSMRLQAMMKVQSQIQQATEQRQTLQQQLLNVQDQQRMGRVPSVVEQQQVQQIPAVDQQLQQAQQAQQAIVQDLQQNLSPFFQNLAEAIGQPSNVQTIGDVQDDSQKDLLGEVRKAGGMNAGAGVVEKGELDRLGQKESGTTGLINRGSGGLTPDEMREQMRDEGLTLAETPQQFIEEVESRIGQKKTEDQSYEEHARSQMSETEQADAQKLDEVLGDQSHPLTQAYRALDNPKVIYTPKLARDFVKAADSAGFSPDWIESTLADAQERRGLVAKSTENIPNNIPENRPSTRSAEPGVSLSPFKMIEANNKELLNRLYDVNLNSAEGKAGIAKLRDYAMFHNIAQNHVEAHIADIQNWQAKYGVPKNTDQAQSSSPRKPDSEAIVAPQPASEQTPVSSTQKGFDRSQRQLLGTDHTTIGDADYDTYLGKLENLQNETVRGSVELTPSENRSLVTKIIETRKERSVRVKAGRLKALTQKGHVPANEEEREAGRQRQGQVEEESRRQLDQRLGGKPETQQAGRMYDQPLTELNDETIANRIRSNEKIEEMMRGDEEYAKGDVAKKRREYVGKLKEEQQRRQNESQKLSVKDIESRIFNQDATLTDDQLIDYAKDQMEKGVDGKQLKQMFDDEYLKPLEIHWDELGDLHKVLTGESSKTKEFNDRVEKRRKELGPERVAEIEEENLAYQEKMETIYDAMSNPPTLVHSNPAIDGQPIIKETDDGRVVVANPENKGGVSVVKPQESETEEREQPEDHKVGDYVQFTEPVIQYKEGKPFTSTKRVRGKVLEIKSDGSLYLRRQDGGYATKMPSELVDTAATTLPTSGRQASEQEGSVVIPGDRDAATLPVKDQETEEAKTVEVTNERPVDSERLDATESRTEGTGSPTTSPTVAPKSPRKPKVGPKPGSVVSTNEPSGKRGLATEASSEPAQDVAQSDVEPANVKSPEQQIEDIQTETAGLNTGEAVIQSVAEHLEPEPIPEPEPKPKEPKPVKTVSRPLSVLTGASFTIGEDTINKIRSGGAVTKYKQNVDAIQTMRQILKEGRKPTIEEQETMALYAGFGGIKRLFTAGDYSSNMDVKERRLWFERQKELKDLIGEEAYKAANRSIQNAHFTDPHIIKMMWNVAQRLGFTKGRALEPSMGIGSFFGLMPSELKDKVSVAGVELDLTTGEMARMLYPDASVHIQGFQDFSAPDNFFDLAIGNVPFGDYRISDQRYNKLLPRVHNYFFLKALDKVRPGGLVMFITSTGTMDAADTESIRKALSKQADLVSAIRFPAETFGKTALTSVVTDLVILRKRMPGEDIKDESWVKSSKVADPRGPEYKPIALNDWIAAHPEQMLGDFNGENQMYPGRANVDRTEDFEQRLADAVERLPKGIMSDYASLVKTEMKATGEKVKVGGYKVSEGRLLQATATGGLVEVTDATGDRIKRVEGMLKIRDAFDGLIDGELGRTALTNQRKDLNSAYDSFVAKHGPVSDKKNREALEGDPDYYRLAALEDYDSKKKIAKKQPIFTKSTVAGSRAKSKPENISEAVVKSFEMRGEVVLPMIAEDLGISLETAAQELTGKKIAFQSPGGNWELAAHYLSGNVRRKLAEAKLAAATDPHFQSNVDALTDVVPFDVPHNRISVEMGAPWMEPKVITDFVEELFNETAGVLKIHYDRNLGNYTLSFPSHSRPRMSREAVTTWGTQRVPFVDLLELALAGKSAKVTDPVENADGSISQVYNPKETQAANTKLEAIKKRFKDWLWQDDDRKTQLVGRYNDMFNSSRPAEYDVSFMLDETGGGVVPGMAPGWKLRPHQMAAVFRAVIERRGLLAHEVGLGKTLSMIASASELKRLGIARKPAIAIPKKVLPAFAQAARTVFPLLKVHVIDSRDAAKRNTTMSQAATGDHDLILMTHDNLDMLKMKPEFEAEQLQIELDEVNAVYGALRAESGNSNSKDSRIMRQILKRRERLEAKIKDALDSKRKDDTISFEDTGIDFLFVDEFHKYKSLPVTTALGQVKGVPTGDSQRALNMLMRSRYLRQIQNGGGLIAATGTPISNTLVEAWIMAKFLQPDLLEESGVQSFDAWVRNFAESVPALEMGATGEWKTVSRLSKFRNLPELQVMSRMTLDVKTAKETGILDVRPKRIDKVVEVPQSKAQKLFMQVLRERARSVQSGNVEPTIDNFLVISSDGMLMASDPRLVLPGFEEEGGKINALAENVLRVAKEKPGQTQMIFSDSGVSPNAWGFHLYGEIIKKLEKGGIPADKIINFSKLDSDKKVETAVARLNSGDALIAIGHRENMGTGVNAQEKMAAIHQFDVPWKPALVEQSEARGWRQGNTNPSIEIISYVTEGSFDAVKWSAVARKQESIHSFMAKPDTNANREMVEDDDDALTYSQIAAAASGDGDYLRKADLDAKVFKLTMMKQAHDSDIVNRQQEIIRIQDRIGAYKRQVPQMREVAKAIAEIKGREPIYKNHKGEVIEDRKEAANNLVSSYLFAKDSKEKQLIGYYKGLRLMSNGWGQTYMEVSLPGYQQKDVTFNTNTQEPIGTLQSVDRQIANGASEDDADYIEQKMIPSLQADYEALRQQTATEFPFSRQLDVYSRQLNAVNKRLKAKETANGEEGEPLVAGKTDVRETAYLGRSIRRQLREKQLTSSEIPALIEKKLKEIELEAATKMDVWRGYQLRKAEEFLAQMDNDTGLAGMAITAKSVAREQSIYDPELDAPTGPSASLAPTPKAKNLGNQLDVFKYAETIVKSRGSRGVRMYINDHARAIIGAALTDMFKREYKTINAVNLSRAEAYQLATYLNKVADQVPAEYKAGAESLADDIRKMVDNSKGQRTFNIVDVTPYMERHEAEIPSDRQKAADTFKGTVREETFHWSQRKVDGQSIALVGSSWAQSSKGYGKYRRALIERGYPDDPETLAAEIAAKIAAGLYDELGIRTEADHEQAQNWLASYFERVAEKHGIEALTKFDRLLPKAVEAKEKGALNVRERIKAAVEAERGTGANRPRSPGSEGGRVRQADEGGQKDGAQEVRRPSPDDPFESGPQPKAQSVLPGTLNRENVREPGEEAPQDLEQGGAGKPPRGPQGMFSEGEPPSEGPEPFEQTPEQRRLAGLQTIHAEPLGKGEAGSPPSGGQMALKGLKFEHAPSLKRGEAGMPPKGPQQPLPGTPNRENVRMAGESAPLDESPKPFENEPKQEPMFDEKGLPTKHWGKFWANLADVLNLPKALRASGDLSAGGRQGWFLSISPSRWKIAARSFKAGVRSTEAFGLKKGAYKELRQQLRRDPAYKDMVAAGWTPLTSEAGALSAETELFGSRLAGAIPWAKYSEQSYKMNLDFLALETFKIYKKGIDKSSKDVRERFEGYQAAVDWINVSSGRGSYRGRFGQWYKKNAAPFLNVIGWAPGLVYSRIQLLNPVTYGKNLKTPQNRAVFIKQMSELFQSAAVLFVTGGLAMAAGATISTDDDDADFLKIRFGTTRYDVLAGLQQVARLGIRMGEWMRTRVTADDDTEEGQKALRKSSTETKDALLRFGRTKLGPVPGFFVDWLSDWKKVTGERHAPGDFIKYAKEGETMRAIGEATEDPFVSQVLPLFFADMVQAYEKGWRNGGSEGAAVSSAKMLPSVLGLGVQDYDRPEWSKGIKPVLDKFDLDPQFPKRKTGELEANYQARVKSHIADQESAIRRFTDDPNMQDQPKERAKALLKQEISSDGIERLNKIRPQDVEDDRMVRAWIQTGLERLKSSPVFQGMTEEQQKHAIQSYHGRMNTYKAQPRNQQHGYQKPEVVTEQVLTRKIKEAIRAQSGN